MLSDTRVLNMVRLLVTLAARLHCGASSLASRYRRYARQAGPAPGVLVIDNPMASRATLTGAELPDSDWKG
ncbi:MAG: hypothetical protein ACRDSP_01515 [Pseudonocardiaceae bacterium]